ncbi:Glycosyltransferase involved in cell wall bisynthesis [Halogranum gelatinilyticum]|uniref:Glycosyltransferase involved in cell wall bisynthesis n=1 Tax=Halogranum gelatinilyticum TaxID=660521 RepID=A0A1G9XG91_9EURY|nr:glycosyltransferase [Halogranum gelatinilyticum]SDM95466.1 Glycosyltransferase involved in cell wall bisynthesis [Halogranum gelatinilyticum]
MSFKSTQPTVPFDSASSQPTRSVVVPVYAESPSMVVSLVNDLHAAGWQEVVVCADRPDSDLRETLDALATDADTLVSVSETRRGKGGALIDGLDRADADIVGYVDADGAIPVGELDRIYDVVADGDASVAVGSRDVEGDCRVSQTPIRQCLARGYRSLARRVTHAPIEDFQCGAKAFRAEVWEQVSRQMRETGFAFDTELVARVHRRGYEVEEVPIAWDDPGDSSVSPTRDAPDMLRSLYRIRKSVRGPAPEAPGSADDDATKVALVTSHPPNRGHLAEYGEELARAYGQRDDVDVTVLARRSDSAPPVEFRRGYEVRRVWDRDSLDGARALLDELVAGDYDAVQFNIHMTYFGNENVHRFIGLVLPPLLSRVYGMTVLTTMHDLLEVVEEDMVDENIGLVEQAGARAATQLLLMGDASTVTSEEYLDIVTDRYYSPNVHHVPHGTFAYADGGLPHIPEPFRIMVFGHLSPTKDIETVVEAFEQVRMSVPDAELVVAGDSHPGFPDHRETLEAKYGDRPGVEFLGYVEDDEMDDVWGNASAVVMPYRTCTGVSGVFQLAKTYGTAVVSSDVDGMRTSTVETGGDAAFYESGDPTALADTLINLWVDRERLQEIARANADAAAAYTIGDTAERMVELIDREVSA